MLYRYGAIIVLDPLIYSHTYLHSISEMGGSHTHTLNSVTHGVLKVKNSGRILAQEEPWR
jgi:hypothetical protein